MIQLPDWLLNIIRPYKIALQYAGFPRSINNDFKNYKDILRLSPDVYMHLWYENEDSFATQEAVRLFKPKNFLVEQFNRTKFDRFVQAIKGHGLANHGNDPLNGISQFYSREQCNTLRKESNIKYDVVIICRTQVSVGRRITRQELELAKTNLLIPKGLDAHGVNDLFAITCPDIADIYCSVYSNLSRIVLDGYRTFDPHLTLNDRLAEKNVTVTKIELPIYLRNKVI